MIDHLDDAPETPDARHLALEKAVEDIVFACSNLCEVLELENEALRRHDAATVSELTDTKKALGDLYERAMEPLLDDPDLLGELDEELRQSLTALGERLRELVHVNALMLRAEMDATRQLMDIVVNAAKRDANRSGTYGRMGTRADAPGSRGTSMAFNKTL